MNVVAEVLLLIMSPNTVFMGFSANAELLATQLMISSSARIERFIVQLLVVAPS